MDIQGHMESKIRGSSWLPTDLLQAGETTKCDLSGTSRGSVVWDVVKSEYPKK